MKNILKYRALLFVCLISMVGFAVTSCDEDDDLDTSQMGTSGITLKSYGPSPALRGSEIRFIGDNVDKVTAVTIPGAGEITEFTKKEKTEIRLIVPQNAEVGYPVLKTPQGDITAQTLLTFEEPISISSITTANIKAGNKFTIEGDYLNLIAEVIFPENAVVLQENFVSQSREKIEVIVPAEAQSGKIIVSNGAEIPIEVYSDTEANIVAATVTGISPATVKPGTSVKISGTDLNLIGSVVFAGGAVVEFDKPVVNEANTELTVTVPLEAQDGKVTVVAKSGLEYSLETALTMLVPSNLKATPDKGIKPNDVIKVTGVDLDLVVNVSFPNVEGIFDLISQSATEIQVTVPVPAPDEEGNVPEGVRSGDLILNMANGKTATVAFMVQQPVVTGYNPSPVMAGGTLTIIGTDLDLVALITFEGGATVEIENSSPTEITLKVPAVNAVTGNPIFTMKNGETIEVISIDIISPEFCFIPVLPEEGTEIVAGTIFEIEVENADKLTEVRVNGTTTQYILQGSLLHIFIPNSAAGATDFTLISSNGEVTYTLNITGIGIVKDYLWTGRLQDSAIDWSGSHMIAFTSDMYAKLTPGKTMGIDFESVGIPQLRIMGSWWTALPSVVADYNSEWDVVEFPEGSTNYEFVLTQDDIDILVQQGSILFCGGGAIITGLYVY